jgi:hypothetical protein
LIIQYIQVPVKLVTWAHRRRKGNSARPGPMRTVDKEIALCICSSETSVQDYKAKTTRCHEPEYHKLNNIRCGNLKHYNTHQMYTNCDMFRNLTPYFGDFKLFTIYQRLTLSSFCLLVLFHLLLLVSRSQHCITLLMKPSRLHIIIYYYSNCFSRKHRVSCFNLQHF